MFIEENYMGERDEIIKGLPNHTQVLILSTNIQSSQLENLLMVATLDLKQ